MFKKILGQSLNSLLEQDAALNRLAFELKYKHFDALDISVPLTPRLRCPIVNIEHWYSFTEIFIDHEYSAAFKDAPLPERWLDLGCHAGYFSLYLVWLWQKCSEVPALNALLVDADPRCIEAVKKLISINSLENSLVFQQGLITNDGGNNSFTVGGIMSSARAADASKGEVIEVTGLSASELVKKFPPPYDLIKLDIEGAEYDFLLNYDSVAKQSKHILIEWHSWHTGGGGLQQIKVTAEELGFSVIREIMPARTVQHKEQDAECGLLLLQNNERHSGNR